MSPSAAAPRLDHRFLIRSRGSRPWLLHVAAPRLINRKAASFVLPTFTRPAGPKASGDHQGQAHDAVHRTAVHREADRQDRPAGRAAGRTRPVCRHDRVADSDPWPNPTRAVLWRCSGYKTRSINDLPLSKRASINRGGWGTLPSKAFAMRLLRGHPRCETCQWRSSRQSLATRA